MASLAIFICQEVARERLCVKRGDKRPGWEGPCWVASPATNTALLEVQRRLLSSLNASAVDLNFAGIQVQILKRDVLAGAVRGQFSFELRLTAVTVGLHRIMHIRFFDSNFRVTYMDVYVTTARAFHQQSHNIGIEPLQWAGCPGERMARLVPTRAAIWANPKAI
jgi:hypothetical protein